MIIGIFDSGQKIITDGLVLHLDAGQLRSYPGSGTTWTDLSGNGLDASGNASFISSAGVTSGASWSTASTSILNTNTHSIFFMFRMNSTPNIPNGYSGQWDKLFSYNPSGSDRSPGVWRYPVERRFHWRYDPGNTGIDFYSNAGTTPFSLNVWYYIGVTKNNASALAYVNGVNVQSATVANPKTAGDSAVVINPSYTAQISTMNCVMIYNRVLSSTEILQNFNAIKSRFGYT